MWAIFSLAVQQYLNAICQIPGMEGIRRDVLRDDEQVSLNSFNFQKLMTVSKALIKHCTSHELNPIQLIRLM